MDWPYLGQPPTPPNAQPPDPNREPVEITAGDSISFTRALPDYKASDGWGLSYALRGASGAYTFTSTPSTDGVNHVLTVTAATTAAWQPGHYLIQGRATNSTTAASQVIYNGSIEVKMNLATAAAIDVRTHARKVLDMIRSVIEGKAGTDVMSSSIEGVSFSHATFDELQRLESRYASLVATEESADAIKAGKRSGRQIIFRLKR